MRNGTLQKVGSAGIERADPALPILSCRDDNRRDVRPCCPRTNFAYEFSTVHFWHTVIDNKQVGRLGNQPLKGLHRAVETFGGKFRTHHRHILRVDPQICGAIVDYDNARMHNPAIRIEHQGIVKDKLAPGALSTLADLRRPAVARIALRF